jgi:hypothetical protein
MPVVTVPVIANHEYQGKSLRAGEDVTLTPVEAAILARLGVVSLTVGYRHPAAPARVRTKRAYRRRDLTAQE